MPTRGIITPLQGKIPVISLGFDMVSILYHVP